MLFEKDKFYFLFALHKCPENNVKATCAKFSERIEKTGYARKCLVSEYQQTYSANALNFFSWLSVKWNCAKEMHGTFVRNEYHFYCAFGVAVFDRS